MMIVYLLTETKRSHHRPRQVLVLDFFFPRPNLYLDSVFVRGSQGFYPLPIPNSAEIYILERLEKYWSRMEMCLRARFAGFDRLKQQAHCATMGVDLAPRG